jgi:hypothetical protein
MADEIFDTVRKRVESSVHPIWPHTGAPTRSRILVTFTGQLSPSMLNFRAVQDLSTIDFYDLGVTRTPAPYIEQFDLADYVVACDPGMDENLSNSELDLVYGWVPNASFQDQILSALRARKDYTLVDKLEYPPNHRNFYIFRKSGPFDGLNPVSGIGPIEGPYPQWNMPFPVRWAIMPASHLIPIDGSATSDGAGPDQPLAGPGRYDLVLSAATQLDGQEMVVQLDGRELGRYAFAEQSVFYDLSYPVDLTPGPHQVTLLFKKGQGPNPAFKMAVLFRTLKLQKLSDPGPSTAPASKPATEPVSGTVR